MGQGNKFAIGGHISLPEGEIWFWENFCILKILLLLKLHYVLGQTVILHATNVWARLP